VFHHGQCTLARFGVVGIGQGGRRAPAVSGEPSGKVARLDNHDPHAKGGYLQAQRLAQALDGELGRAIESLERNADDAGDRADVDDEPRALGAHGGQSSAAHAQHAEEAGLELGARLIGGGILHRAGDPHAGVVHHHVEAALGLDHIAHAALHRGVVGHIHGDHDYAGRTSGLGGTLRERSTAASSVDAVSQGGEVLGTCPADPRGCAGDQDDALLVSIGDHVLLTRVLNDSSMACPPSPRT